MGPRAGISWVVVSVWLPSIPPLSPYKIPPVSSSSPYLSLWSKTTTENRQQREKKTPKTQPMTCQTSTLLSKGLSPANISGCAASFPPAKQPTPIPFLCKSFLSLSFFSLLLKKKKKILSHILFLLSPPLLRSFFLGKCLCWSHVRK